VTGPVTSRTEHRSGGGSGEVVSWPGSHGRRLQKTDTHRNSSGRARGGGTVTDSGGDRLPAASAELFSMAGRLIVAKLRQ
jgi:hypothetical protein